MVVKRMVRHQDALEIPKKCILFVRLDYTDTHTSHTGFKDIRGTNKNEKENGKKEDGTRIHVYFHSK